MGSEDISLGVRVELAELSLVFLGLEGAAITALPTRARFVVHFVVPCVGR